ncbi:MAG: hypothetical protein H3C28_15415 [Sphingomonadales bacterium]|nr:hypothetical protein [Sphingomonadales bacterium]
MTMIIIRNYMTVIVISLWAMLGAAGAGNAPLANTKLKFIHVVHDANAAHFSEAVYVEVRPDTDVTINTGRGYVINVTSQHLTIRFIRNIVWDSEALFTGVVIANIAWSNAAERTVKAIKLRSNIPGVSDERSEVFGHTALINLRDLSTKVGDKITIEVETKNDSPAPSSQLPPLVRLIPTSNNLL